MPSCPPTYVESPSSKRFIVSMLDSYVPPGVMRELRNLVDWNGLDQWMVFRMTFERSRNKIGVSSTKPSSGVYIPSVHELISFSFIVIFIL